MKWITREKVKVDRVACPWLIKKFVDKDAEFVFVPAEKVMAEAKRLDAIPYDVKDFKDDHAQNAAEWIVYDALYAYCREMVKRGKPNGDFMN